MSDDPAFDPARHLTRVSGNDYLETRWRIAWLRDEAPDSLIETEALDLTPEWAVFRATVTKVVDGVVVGRATGHGSESTKDFKDHIEKAETSAIGRALAHLGYGTQFVSGEAAANRPDDTPVPIRREQRGPTDNQHGGHAPDQPATQRQLVYLQAVAREAGVDKVGLDEMAMADFGVVAGALSRRDASTLIERLGQRRQDVPR